jgi:serine/threonine protein kinase/TolA-binding protein
MLAPDQQLGAYRLIARIGAGGMGEVWKAEDPRLGRDVAIKILPSSVASEPDAIARMRREARTVAQLYHPNIATIHSFEEADGQTFIVMEFVSGQPLSHAIRQHALSEADVCRIGRGVADALAEAHEKGIVHRDIKPDNIIVNGSRVKVLDFGIAKRIGVETTTPDSPTAFVTQQGMIVGTVHYMSPEQALGKPFDARTDIFSLGVVLYEAATGKLPFAGETVTETITQIIRDEPQEPILANPAMSPGLSAIIQKCLKKNRDERFATASELSSALEAQLAKAPTDLYTNPNIAAIGPVTAKQPTSITGSKMRTVKESMPPTEVMPTTAATTAVRPDRASAPRVGRPTVRQPPPRRSAWAWIVAIVLVAGAAVVGAIMLNNRATTKRSEAAAVPAAAPPQPATAPPIAPPSTTSVAVTAPPVIEEKSPTTTAAATGTTGAPAEAATAKRPAEAATATQESSEATPKEAAPEPTADQLYQQGLSLLVLGDNGDARKKFYETLQKNPQHAGALFRTGEIALLNHNLGHAAEQFEKALSNKADLDPRERALSQLGLTIARGNRERANFIAREIESANPQDPDLQKIRQAFDRLFGGAEQQQLPPRRRRRP